MIVLWASEIFANANVGKIHLTLRLRCNILQLLYLIPTDNFMSIFVLSIGQPILKMTQIMHEEILFF